MEQRMGTGFQEQKNPNIKRIAFIGMLTAYAMILSYIESLIPFFFGIPGMKLGLANLAVVISLYLLDEKAAVLINGIRIFLSGVLFSNLFAIGYSLFGAIFSFAVMLLLKRFGQFSVLGVSVAGGVFHNVGQIIMAVLVFKSLAVVYYLPPLILCGIITGAGIGLLSETLFRYLRRFIKSKGNELEV